MMPEKDKHGGLGFSNEKFSKNRTDTLERLFFSGETAADSSLDSFLWGGRIHKNWN